MLDGNTFRVVSSIDDVSDSESEKEIYLWLSQSWQNEMIVGVGFFGHLTAQNNLVTTIMCHVKTCIFCTRRMKELAAFVPTINDNSNDNIVLRITPPPHPILMLQ